MNAFWEVFKSYIVMVAVLCLGMVAGAGMMIYERNQEVEMAVPRWVKENNDRMRGDFFRTCATANLKTSTDVELATVVECSDMSLMAHPNYTLKQIKELMELGEIYPAFKRR
jgi:hypothetical protein